MEWMTRLTPRTRIAFDATDLSDDEVVVAERFGADALAWGVEVAQRLVDGIFANMPWLPDEATLPRVFARGVRSSVMRMMRMVGGEDLEPITDEGADVARDFARRDLELTELLQSIRIGTAVMAAAHIEGASAFLSPDARAEEISRLSGLFFVYVDRFSRQMSEAYEIERDRWRSTHAAERLVLVNDLLADRTVDAGAIRRLLRYDLAGPHAAVIAWAELANVDESERLTTAATDELRALGATSTLVVPVGIGAVWAWGDAPDAVGRVDVSPPPGVFTATSQVHDGRSGFRRAHREARAVEHLMRLAAPGLARAVRHADVELATLLAADLESAQHFVRRQLGALARNDGRAGKIRETLRLYLAHERSVARVAEAQFVARNTVTYRIKQAESLTGKRVDDHRLDLQSALLLAHLLGPRVLLAG